MRAKSGWVRPILQASLLLALVLALLLTQTAQACRFNVRDVGFVDLGSQPYKLYCYIDSRTPAELVTQIGDISLAALLDSNIEAEVVNLDTAKGHPGLEFATLEEHPGMPFAVLVSPEKRSLLIPLVAPGEAPAESLWSAFESLYESTWRDEVMATVLETYGAVILLEGSDPTENQKARDAAEKSIATIAGLIRDKKLEKEIANPPRLHVLTREQAAKERVTLWSLGIDLDAPGAQMAMLYGRGRQIGRVLKGPQLNDRTVHAVMNTIGLSCECGLDRSWMQGAMLPLKWDEDVQQRIAKHLGFDPEDPAIKMEMSQILSKGGAGQGARIKVAQADIDTLLNNYSESNAAQAAPASDDSVMPAASGIITPTKAPATTPDVAPAHAEAPKQNRSGRLRPLLLILGGVAAVILGAGVFILLRGRGNR